MSGHQDQLSIMPESWVTPWSGPGPCHWQCCWCCCTSGSSETCTSQLSMVKNIYLDTKIYLLRCQGVELHLEVALDHVAIVLGVGVHWGVLKPVPINSAWSKTYIWTPRSNFYNAMELSYTLKWPLTMSLSVLFVLAYIWQFWNLFLSTRHGKKVLKGFTFVKLVPKLKKKANKSLYSHFQVVTWVK